MGAREMFSETRTFSRTTQPSCVGSSASVSDRRPISLPITGPPSKASWPGPGPALAKRDVQ
jgi:hypothetical protein